MYKKISIFILIGILLAQFMLMITMPLCFDGCGESGSNIVRIHSNIIMILAAMGLILSIAMLTIEGILNINSIKEKTYLIIFSTFSVLYFVILYFSYK